MVVQTLPNSAGGYTAAIKFHDDRMLVQWPVFSTEGEARAYGERWVRAEQASHARHLAEAGRHIQAVEA
jgi:hypothetical protein